LAIARVIEVFKTNGFKIVPHVIAATSGFELIPLSTEGFKGYFVIFTNLFLNIAKIFMKNKIFFTPH
jgi:hypothetical protein